MAIHALQGGGKNALFRRRRKEMMSSNTHLDPPIDKPGCQRNVLAGLAQPSNVCLDCLRQFRECEIPFAGKPVAPAARLHLGAKTLGKDLNDLRLAARG